ncbi:MAG: NUDIX hydrolase [Spirochaetaceae bacterium]|nr:NUDIX hydrolase [Spirochaetaceae bacterium]
MKLIEKLVESKVIFKFDGFSLNKDTVIMPNGNIKERTYLSHPGGVAILAINEKNEIAIVNQYRNSIKMITKEIPAGKTDKDPLESDIDAAKRELREETGYIAKDISYLGKTYPSAGILDEKLEMFFARNLIKDEMDLDDDEFINIEWIHTSKFEEMIKEKIIIDTKSICAYFMAKLNNLI